jgi:hypothetical protein
LTAYLEAEADLGRIQSNNLEVAASVLFSHLHHLVLSQTIGAHSSIDTDRAISEAIAVLWSGLAS